ncbi:MAG: glycoside hydrolase family 127 protein [Acidobacteriota bacterium]|nr:glycoside hydrolase family 127 protein [Acidobacteriota bacterium]
MSFTRREFVLGTAGMALAARIPLRAAPASTRPLAEFDYDQVRLIGGPLKAHYDRIHATYLALDNDRLLKVYRQRAGLPAPGADMGGWYDADGFVPGHTLGQYISGIARIGATTGDADCHAKAGALVEGFAAAFERSRSIYAGPNAEKIWPCYILDKHLAGLIDAGTLSHVERAHDLLSRVYNTALPYIPEQGRDRIGKKDPPYDETYVLPENLFTAAAMTGDGELRERAIRYLLDKEFFDPLARGEDVLPGRHAYSHAIALSSAGKAHLVLHDPKYLQAMQHAWMLLTETQQFATGGWGPNEQFIEPHKGQLYSSLLATQDHFETPCGSYAATKLARYLLCATGDARYGDGLERVLFNALLAAKDPDSDGDYPYYSTYSAAARKVYYPKKWPCCSGTLVQGVADYVKNIYFRADDGIRVNLYAPSIVRWQHDGATVTLTQETDYPLDIRVMLRVHLSAPVAFSLGLRLPAWLAAPATLRVNGAVAQAPQQQGWAMLHRVWRDGDSVQLDLPQDLHLEAIDDQHPETVALLRGPLVYVELNPRAERLALIPLDRIQSMPGASGLLAASTTGENRVFAPLYFVQQESYTTYFQKS